MKERQAIERRERGSRMARIRDDGVRMALVYEDFVRGK